MHTILVPVDFSDASPRVLETARSLAQALASRLVLLHVAEPEPDFVGFEPGPIAVQQSVVHDYKLDRARLEDMRQQFAAGSIEAEALHLQGPLIETILREADAQGAAWIVIGSHGHGALYDLLVGSITHGVLKGAKCPVVVVPAAIAVPAEDVAPAITGDAPEFALPA